MRRRVRLIGLVLTAWNAGWAQPVEAVGPLLANFTAPGLTRTAVGVTRAGTPIPAWVADEDADYGTPKRRILLVGGLDGAAASVEAAAAGLRWFWTAAEAAEYRRDFLVSAVPVVNPGAWAGAAPDDRLMSGYPPTGKAYQSETAVEAQYLWRWIGLHAPDLVIVVSAAPAQARADRLAAALREPGAMWTGAIPALEVFLAEDGQWTLRRELARIAECDARAAQGRDQGPPCQSAPPSPARVEMRRRVGRSAAEIATELARFYGHELDRVMYIPALALISRLRLGELTGDASHLADVERIVEPYFRGGKPTVDERPSASHWPGHLVFGELYRLTGKARYLELARSAAERGFVDGEPLNAMPLHNEMSDSVFMGGAIQAQVGRLTGERRFLDMALRNTRAIQGFCLRPDGLYRHSPLAEAAWGRGNGFPALGLALLLSDLPRDHPQWAVLAREHRDHLRVLATHQDVSGAWHQVIDRPESYREFTATAMIAFAMLRGMREGWLDEAEFRGPAQRAWTAVKARIGAGGWLADVCTGTGKQESLRAYYDREAILGKDDRGGAMAMMLATEWMAWEMGR